MTRKYEKPLHIDMPFGELLERFAGTDPAEIPENKKLKRRRSARGKKPPAGKSGKKGGSRQGRER